MTSATEPNHDALCRSCGAPSPGGLCNACIGRSIGRVIGGRIRLLRLLGQGGMGAVYEGRHETIGRRFAVKLLHHRLLENPRALERFRLEALTAAQVESQHIAAALDLGTEEDGTPFIVMEYLQGYDLATLLARETVPPRRAIEIVIQACLGLSAAHARRLLHRDLKPANLFVCQTDWGDDLVKVLDFGLAKLLDPASLSGTPSTASGALLGTPAYMSPEQARGEVDLDARTDVYAMGLILYECLAQRRAFQAPNANALLFKVMTETPAPLGALRPDLPSALVATVERAIHKDLSQRHPTINAFSDDLDHLVLDVARPGGSSEARLRTQAQPPSKVGSRRPWLPWTLGVSAAAAVTVFATLGYRHNLQNRPAVAPLMVNSPAVSAPPALPKPSVNDQPTPPPVAAFATKPKEPVLTSKKPRPRRDPPPARARAATRRLTALSDGDDKQTDLEATSAEKVTRPRAPSTGHKGDLEIDRHNPYDRGQ